MKYAVVHHDTMGRAVSPRGSRWLEQPRDPSWQVTCNDHT